MFLISLLSYVKNLISEFLHIDNILEELNRIHHKLIELEERHYEPNGESKPINLMYPPIDDLLDYTWTTFKFQNVIPRDKTTNQIQINLKHTGFKTNFSTIHGANHKMLIKVVDPKGLASWQTPWMDACNATSLDAMFPVDGTRCIYGIFSNTEKRVCYIGAETSHEAIFYIRVGIPTDVRGKCLKCQEITLEPVNKLKRKSKI